MKRYVLVGFPEKRPNLARFLFGKKLDYQDTIGIVEGDGTCRVLEFREKDMKFFYLYDLNDTFREDQRLPSAEEFGSLGLLIYEDGPELSEYVNILLGEMEEHLGSEKRAEDWFDNGRRVLEWRIINGKIETHFF